MMTNNNLISSIVITSNHTRKFYRERCQIAWTHRDCCCCLRHLQHRSPTTTMAAMTSTLGQAKLGYSTRSLRARQPAAARSAPIRTQASAGGSALNEMVPDRNKRTTMNWLLVGGLGLPGTALLGPFAYFFKPNM